MEELCDLLIIHSDPRIADRKAELYHVSSVFSQDGTYFDLARISELDRIPNEVKKDLTQAMWISDEVARNPWLEAQQELKVLLIGCLRREGAHGLDDILQIEVDLLHIELARLDFREIENVIDNTKKRGSSVVDLRHSRSASE